MRVRYADAFRAWSAGDTDRGLELCARVRSRDADGADAIALLRARALLRLRRAADAIVLLHEHFPGAAAGDASLTARMLLGTAYVRSGESARGLAILAEASRDADGAPVVLRSEIALGTALAHYGRHDFAGAERALESVDPDADIVSARAAELRGWIAKSRNEFVAAVVHFEAALDALDRAQQFDRFLEGNLVMVLGYFAAELLDFERWARIEQRARRVRWDATGLGFYRFWVEMNRSMMDEIEGRPRDALQAARSASEHAPSNAFRIFAKCRRAAVLFAYGELLGYEDLAASIRHEFESVDLGSLHEFEEISLPAIVAETLALIGDETGALAARARIDAMSPEQLALLTDEPMKRAYLAFVEGVVADANSDAFTAQHRYRDAFRAFRALGMTRRALIAGMRLAELIGDAAALAYADEETRKLPPASWIRERYTRTASWHEKPLLAQLTRAEREVLALLYEGQSTVQIAVSRGRSTQTIRNTVSKLLKTFSVDSRAALIRECSQRGVFAAPPASGDDARARRGKPLP